MTTTFILQFIGVALAIFFADMCWTLYMIHTANRHAFKAGVWSAMIMFCGSFATISYVQNFWFILAAMIGGFAGTWVTIKWKNRTEKS